MLVCENIFYFFCFFGRVETWHAASLQLYTTNFPAFGRTDRYNSESRQPPWKHQKRFFLLGYFFSKFGQNPFGWREKTVFLKKNSIAVAIKWGKGCNMGKNCFKKKIISLHSIN